MRSDFQERNWQEGRDENEALLCNGVYYHDGGYDHDCSYDSPNAARLGGKQRNHESEYCVSFAAGNLAFHGNGHDRNAMGQSKEP